MSSTIQELIAERDAASIEVEKAQAIFTATVDKIPSTLKSRDFAIAVAASGVYAAMKLYALRQDQFLAAVVESERSHYARLCELFAAYDKSQLQLTEYRQQADAWRSLAEGETKFVSLSAAPAPKPPAVVSATPSSKRK